MWKILAKIKRSTTVLETSNYEKEIWNLLADRKLFSSQFGYDVEEIDSGFIAKLNGEEVATYRICNDERRSPRK